MKVLIIDNYDSFTYNLYQCVGELLEQGSASFDLQVVRNDEITEREIRKRAYERIIISPGPGDPSDPAYFGVCAKVLLNTGKHIPVLGVCLGMQGMAQYFGGRVKRADRIMHGKTSIITHDGKGIFRGLPQGIEVMRYHSLVADSSCLPSCLTVSAIVSVSGNGEGEIMGLRHKKYPIEGIQFHPESFATEGGNLMLKNFLFQNRESRFMNQGESLI